MEYQNNLMPFNASRIHPVLQHYTWLEYAKKDILDFTKLSEPFAKKPLGLTASELSQLSETEKETLKNRLLNFELIFLILKK